jgi:hypothetical protein
METYFVNGYELPAGQCPTKHLENNRLEFACSISVKRNNRNEILIIAEPKTPIFTAFEIHCFDGSALNVYAEAHLTSDGLDITNVIACKNGRSVNCTIEELAGITDLEYADVYKQLSENLAAEIDYELPF